MTKTFSSPLKILQPHRMRWRVERWRAEWEVLLYGHSHGRSRSRSYSNRRLTPLSSATMANSLYRNSTAITRPSLTGDRVPPSAGSKMIPARSPPKSPPSTAPLLPTAHSGVAALQGSSSALRQHLPNGTIPIACSSEDHRHRCRLCPALRVEVQALEPEKEGAPAR